jgi:tetratricopeptide (TPR) repeat protein
MFKTLITTVVLVLATPSFAASAQQGRNSIEGHIITSDNRVIDNVRVFLLNDGYSQIKQIYADASGRYQFKGLSAGDYYVQVEPAGSGYERQMQRVEVNPFTMGRRPGAEIFRVDFVLRPDKSRVKTGVNESAAAHPNAPVFYQDVPLPAKTAYELGLQSLRKEDLKTAEVNLIQAIRVFPDFYEALDVLGSEYVKHAAYDAALPLLAHAVEINKEGWHALYSLGVVFIESNKRAEGLEALHRAVELNPKSINASMRLGLELAKDSKRREEAIKALTNVTHLAGKHLPEAYLILASLYSKNMQYREAADALERYLQSSPATNQRASIKQKIQQLRHKA